MFAFLSSFSSCLLVKTHLQVNFHVPFLVFQHVFGREKNLYANNMQNVKVLHTLKWEEYDKCGDSSEMSGLFSKFILCGFSPFRIIIIITTDIFTTSRKYNGGGSNQASLIVLFIVSLYNKKLQGSFIKKPNKT